MNFDRGLFQPRGESTQMYSVVGSKHDNESSLKCLVGTAEIPLAGYNIDRTFSLSDLPKRFAGFGRCFRAETGAGQHSRGLYRLHQFTKVEMFSVTDKTQSEQELEFLLSMQKQLFSELDIPFRCLLLTSLSLNVPLCLICVSCVPL